MPNRILKESICRSEKIDKLSFFEEALFYRLIVNCDDYGRMDGRNAIIKSVCFPLKDGVTRTGIEKAIHKLVTVGLVNLYEVDGEPILSLPNWDCHQQIRAKRSKYPAPKSRHVNAECIEQKSDSICNHMISNDCKCPRESESESESEYKNNILCSGAALHTQKDREPGPIAGTAESLFEELWQAYPQKRGKASVSKTTKTKLLKIGRDQMLRAITRYVSECKAKNRYLQNGSTFFHSGYVDYLDDNYTEPERTGEELRGGMRRNDDIDAFLAEQTMKRMEGIL